IGMLHLQPLPGSPRWEGSMARVIDGALADARALVDGGMDALLVENYGDAPFTAGRVAAATVAGVTAVAAEIRRAFDQTLLGVNVLKNDARAAPPRAGRRPAPTSSGCGTPSPTCRSSSAAASLPRRWPSSSPSRTGRSSAPPSSVTATYETPSIAPGWSGSLPRLVAASLLV